MCSIAGIINFADPAAAAATVQAMNDAQAHRGPDGEGILHSGRAVLGHRRLAIVGLQNGAQPMTGGDGRISAVCNGEIYNYPELRKKLEDRGHTFRTACDSEVIVHLYEEYGSDMPRHLCGMFAFAVWDAQREQLFMAADRFGQKPLAYFVRNAELVFASELAALQKHPAFPAEISPETAARYLSLSYVPADRSIFRHVHKLLPGHSLLFHARTGRMELTRYFDISYTPKLDISFSDAVHRVRELVISAVEKRLMSDVPVGTFLSGGADSAIVTAAAAELLRKNGGKMQAFTMGFDNALYDERHGAQITAERINRNNGGMLEHCIDTADPADWDTAERLLSHFGEPFADASLIPTGLLCRFASQHVKTVLSGDGADEIFAGYDRYLAVKFAGFSDKMPPFLRRAVFGSMSKILPDAGERTLPGRLRRFCRAAAQAPGNRYFAILDRCPPELKTQLFGERLAGQINADSGASLRRINLTAAIPAEKAAELDLHTYLPGDILRKTDIASMGFSLEVRSPFLDHELAEFAAALPFEFKQRGRTGKHVLKAAFADILPEQTVNAPKRGFAVPLAHWLRHQWHNRIRAIIFDGPLTGDGWMNASALEDLWQNHRSGRSDHSHLLWSLAVLSLFLQQKK